MIKTTVIILFLFAIEIFSQQKYFIYFIDKGIENQSTLNKSSLAYSEAIQNLTSRAIERRTKTMDDNFITYDDLPVYKNYLDEISRLNINIIRKLNWFNSVSALLTNEQIENIKILPFVKSIEPVKKLYFKSEWQSSPGSLIFKTLDTTYNYGSSFNQMNLSDVPVVHSKSVTGKDVLIGILDSGFDWKQHNSLKDRNVLAEYDFIFNDSVTANQPEDIAGQDSHGTYVFSVLAGFEDSVLIGPAFNASFILAKTEDIRGETHIEEDNYAAALIWMESLGVDITSSSLGYNIFDSGYSYSYADMDGRTTIVTKAANLAFERGVAIFTAAGNEGSNSSWGGYILAPADAYNIVSVGAVDASGDIAGFSGHGPTSDGRIKPEVVAQGVNVYGAVSGTINSYRYANGTSAATPIASGIGALLLSAHPYLKNTQLRSIFLETSSNSSTPNNQLGYGLISAKNAIEFPNLQFVNGNYNLKKTIFQKNIIPQSVKVTFSYDDLVLPEEQFNTIDEFNYTITVPQQIEGKEITFYIEYLDSLNNSYRFPTVGEYKFNYGSNIISLNVQVQTAISNYEVSNFYPNPFIPANHKTVRINYQSSGNEIFKLAIIDGAGQKVKNVSTITLPGHNYFEWDGYSEHGYLCASGVYYALIQLSGNEFGKKLVLLK